MKLIHCLFLLSLVSLTFQFDAATLETIRADILKRHNELRALHGVEPLERDTDLETISQQYADKTLAQNLWLVHSENTKGGEAIGENIAVSYNSIPITSYSGTDATNQWYNEIANYDFDTGKKINESGKAIGHFTQVVWKTSKKIGCGAIETTEKISTAGGTWYTATIICNYYPAGNYIGQNVQNVPKLLQEDPSNPTDPTNPTDPSNPSNSTDSTGEDKESEGEGFALRLSKYLLMMTLILF